MEIAVVGSDARAEAIASLLLTAGHEVSRTKTQSRSIRAPVVVLAGSRGAQTPPTPVGPHAVLVDAMDGRATLETERSLADQYGTERIVRALMVLPQAGANVLCCSDDEEAMEVVAELLRSCGCVPTDRGRLSNLTELEPPDPRLDAQFDRLKNVNRVAEP